MNSSAQWKVIIMTASNFSKVYVCASVFHIHCVRQMDDMSNDTLHLLFLTVITKMKLNLLNTQ